MDEQRKLYKYFKESGEIFIMDNYDIKSVIKELNLEDIYDEIRILDPIKKKVFNLKENNYEDEPAYCFSIWGNSKACKNCISMRAFREDKISTKIERKSEKTYMVFSVPINLNCQRFVIELFKEITNPLFLDPIIGAEPFKNSNDEVVKDSTTNVFNRRYLDERIETDILNCKNNNSNLTILLANIDNFRTINKKYGHLTGDAILSEFANEIDNLIDNEGNWIARYGGDEFIICLNNISKNDAYDIAEKMRKTIENRKFYHENEIFMVTASIGMTEINEEINTFEGLLDLAEINLQIAKNTGRNKVITDEHFPSKTANI